MISKSVIVKIVSSFFTIGMYFSAGAQVINYPVADEAPVTDVFYDKYKVTDDYRWMEKLDDTRLKKWVDDENDIAKKFVSRASNKNDALFKIEQLSNVTYNRQVKKGKYYFHYAYYNDVSVPALFVRDRLISDEPHVIVDPNFISRKDKISLKDYELSQDSKYLAYEYSRNGSDWAEVGVAAMNEAPLKDHLINVRFSNIAWHGDGFYYSTYPSTDGIGATKGQIVMYHKLGTEQAADEVIFKRNNLYNRFEFSVTKDGRYFILEENDIYGRLYNYFYIDYQQPDATLKPLLTNLNYAIGFVDSHDGKLIARDFHGNANNGSIVEIDPQNPTKWRAITPAYSEALLLNVVPLKDKILAVYQNKLHPGMVVMDYKGNVLHSMTFPLGASVRILDSSPADAELLYSYETYTTPPIVYTFNIENYEHHLTAPTSAGFDASAFEYKDSEYRTKDSVTVPILLIYKKGIKLNGNNPTLLESYGGFGVVNTPHFSPGTVFFLQRGGVYAYAYVRGGGDLGARWWASGRGKYKQNSFNDFVAGAEYLIKAGYTRPSKLAISGASNGGLLVAAAAMQRPDLFKAVIPVVAPFDMLRFENFTIGSFHINEYGTVKDSTSFTRLYNYSPYNNIKKDVNYPTMLVITSQNDDRVPPLHSYKFVAKMQSRPAQTNPILLLTREQSGHAGAGDNSYRSEIREEADFYGFVLDILK